MKYYIDCEFDGLNGPLLSMALVSETDKSFYAVLDYRDIRNAWVHANVHPVMLSCPLHRISHCEFGIPYHQLAPMLERYFLGDEYPHVIADWPDDIKYLCDALITGPGTMIDIPGIKFTVRRVDAYPTTLKGAIQHNAWWDAMALRHLLLTAGEVQVEGESQ